MARQKNARRTPSLEEGEIRNNQTGNDHLPAQRKIYQQSGNSSGAGRKRKSPSAESSPLPSIPPSENADLYDENENKSPPNSKRRKQPPSPAAAKSGSQARAGATITSSRPQRTSTKAASTPFAQVPPSASPLPDYEFYEKSSSDSNETKQTPPSTGDRQGRHADDPILIGSSSPRCNGTAAAIRTPVASPLTPPPLDPLKEKANPPNSKGSKQPHYNSAAANSSIANIIHDMRLKKSAREDRSSAPSPDIRPDIRPGIHPDRQALMARPASDSAHSPTPADSPARSKKQSVQGAKSDAGTAPDQPRHTIRNAPQGVNNRQGAAPEVIDLGSGSEDSESQKDARPPEMIDLVTRSGDEKAGSQKGGRSRGGRPSGKAGKQPEVALLRNPPRGIEKNAAGVYIADWDKETSTSAPFRPHIHSLTRMAKEYKAKKAQDKQKRDAEGLRRRHETEMTATEYLPGHIIGAELGQGGFGVASVWVKLDKENNIVDVCLPMSTESEGGRD